MTSRPYRPQSQETYSRKAYDRHKKGVLWLAVKRLRSAGLVSAGASIVYEHLLFQHLNCKTGDCNPSYATLAKALGLCVDTVRRRLAELRDCGLLVWTNLKKIVRVKAGQRCLGQASNGYRFVDISQKPMQKQHVPRDAEIQSQTHYIKNIIARLKPRESEPVDKSVDNAPSPAAASRSGAPGSVEGRWRQLDGLWTDVWRPQEEAVRITDYSNVPLSLSPALMGQMVDKGMVNYVKRGPVVASSNLLNSRLMAKYAPAPPVRRPWWQFWRK